MTLLEQVEAADPKFLALSRKDCPAFNVSVIILNNTDVLFLGWPGHDFGGGGPETEGRDGHGWWRFEFQNDSKHPFLDKEHKPENMFEHRGELIEHVTDFMTWFPKEL